jgi:hypothetical protein
LLKNRHNYYNNVSYDFPMVLKLMDVRFVCICEASGSHSIEITLNRWIAMIYPHSIMIFIKSLDRYQSVAIHRVPPSAQVGCCAQIPLLNNIIFS